MSTSPYRDTKLFTRIALRPNQMNNKIYINLKKNLEDKLLNKCYKDYGFIDKIYKISNYGQNIINQEDYICSAIYNISFHCHLCLPVNGQYIICKVNNNIKAMTTANNGPIIAIIDHNQVNKNVFSIGNDNIKYKEDGKYYDLKVNNFIRVKVLGTRFNHNDKIIKCICYLDNMATEEEINSFYEDNTS